MIERIGVVQDKCKACRRCEIACIAAHHNMDFKEATKQKDVLVSRVKVVKDGDLKITVRCHQCQPAPCCKICPVGALTQDEDGRIVMREELCVACQMCVSVCPYGAVALDSLPESQGDGNEKAPARTCDKREFAVRCDMCHAWRIENGKKITACMEACPVRGLYLIESDGSIVEVPKPEKKAAPAKSEA